MITKKPATTGRNVYGVRADRLQVLYAFDEGSGDTLTNDGKGLGEAASAWDAVLYDRNAANHPGAANVWKTDSAEGKYVDLNDTTFNNAGADDDPHFRLHAAAAADTTYDRGTIMIRFSLPSNRFTGTSSSQYMLFNSGGGGPQFGRIIVSVPTNETFLRVSMATDGTTDGTLDFTNFSLDTIYTLIFTWGEGGIKAWLDGTLGTYSDTSLTPSILPMFTVSGKEPRLGANQTASIKSFPNLYTFAWWDFPLNDIERDELRTDPYICLRPRSTAFKTDINPQVGRVTKKRATFNVVTKDTIPGNGTAGLRIKYSTNKFLESNVVTSTAATTTNTDKRLEKVLINLKKNTTYYWLAEYDAGDGVWELFPGGRGKLVTQRTRGDFNFTIVTDCHYGNIFGNITSTTHENDDFGYGKDIVDNVTSNGTKPFRLWKSLQDIHKNIENSDFTMHLGDSFMSDVGTQSNIELKNASWRNFYNLMLKTGSFYMVGGNHEGEAGYLQNRRNGVNSPQQMYSTIARKKYLSLPTNTTYPEGGEGGSYGTSSDWIPTGTSDDGTTFDYDSASYKSTNITNATEDPDGENASPLENFYAFTWSNCLFVFLDIYRYTEPGDPAIFGTGGRHVRPSPTWTLGTVQKKWLRHTLRNSRAKWKCVLIHNLPGENIGITGGNGFYGRGSGANIGGTDSTTEEQEIHEIFRKTGVTAVFKGHDHKLCHVIKDGVNYITCPAVAAPSINWHWDKMVNSYGSAELQGSDKDEVQTYYNVYGYLRVSITRTTFRIILRQCSHAINTDFVSMTGTIQERFIGSLSHIPDSGSVTTLTETPTQVFLAVIESQLTGSWWSDTSAFTQLYNSSFPEGYDEPYSTASITIDAQSGFTSDEPVKIAYVPRTLYNTAITKASIANTRKITITFAGDIGGFENVPADQRNKFKGNGTLLSFPLEVNDGWSKWRFYRGIDPTNKIAFEVTADRAGVTGTIGNVPIGNVNFIYVVLDRTIDWSFQFRVNDGPWSNLQTLNFKVRTITGRHRDSTTSINTSSGATTTTSNPKFTERKTSRGVQITNIIYPSDI